MVLERFAVVLSMLALLLTTLATVPTAAAIAEESAVPPCTLNEEHPICREGWCHGAVDTGCEWEGGNSVRRQPCVAWVLVICIIGIGGSGACDLWVAAVCIIGNPTGNCDLWPIQRDC